jgi:putative ABC transport system permease protein
MFRLRRLPADDTPATPPAWRRYIRFWGARVDDDVDDELAFHLEMRTRDFLARGYSEQEARAAALRLLGDMRDARAVCLTIGHRRERRMTRAQLVDAFGQDLRFALRALNRQRGWATVAIATFALGIGATTAVYSVVNSLVLHPLAYRDANRVVLAWELEPKTALMLGPSEPLLKVWRAQSHSMEGFERIDFMDETLVGRGEPVTVHVAEVQPDFVQFTGIRPVIGRSFTSAEAQPGSDVVMVGEQLWRERFGGSSSALGSRLTLNDKPFTIVGVMPKEQRLPAWTSDQTDVWFPEHAVPFVGGIVIGRVRAGVSIDVAQRELQAIATHNHLEGDNPKYVIRLEKPGDMIGFRTSLLLLAGAVGLLLLVACANVAHLLLARGATRERELAIRTALGAGRRRLARQLLTESFVLAAFGCVIGLALAVGGVHALLALRPASLGQLSLTRIDGRVLVAAIVMSLVTGLAFGLTAALHAVRRTTSESLRATTLAGAGANHSHRLRSVLVVSEMALSALLLVGAVLLVRSVIKLQEVDPGFDAANLYSMKFPLAGPRFGTSSSRGPLVSAVRERATMIPGVRAVTISSDAPPRIGGFNLMSIKAPGSAPGSAPNVFADNIVAPDYFGVLRMPIVQGVSFTAGANDRNEVIINDGFARRLWPGQSALGRQLIVAGGPPYVIVGVAADTPTQGLASDRTDPLVYMPYDPRHVPSSMTVIVRVDRGVDPTVALRSIVRSLEPKMPPPAVVSMRSAIEDTIGSQRFTMTILAIFAGLAVVLSAVGLYGVISYVVTQRTREIGIRIALGATPRHVARMVVFRGLILSVIGLVIGLVAARWGTTLIASTLYGVATSDAASYGAAGALLLAISAVACLVPMRRAMSVDPVIAMRGE